MANPPERVQARAATSPAASNIIIVTEPIPTPILTSTSAASATTSTVSLASSTLSSANSTVSSANSTIPVTSQPPNNSTSTSASPSPTGVAPDSGVSAGAVAGIAIGVFIAGIIVALAGAFIFAMIRKRRRQSSGKRGYPPQEHGGVPRSQPAVIAGADIKLDEYLLESAPDSDITTAVQALGTDIELHVDNFYHKQPVPDRSAMLIDALERCSYDEAPTGIPVARLQALLAHPPTRAAALRHFIGWFIFSRLSLGGAADGSLLPPHIVAFLSAMPPPDRSPESRQAFDQAFFKWRTTSAFLLHSSRTTRGPLTLNTASLSPTIESNITLLNNVLGQFIYPNAGSQASQRDNLREIMSAGAKLGLLIFSQPTSWDFRWTAAGADGADGSNKSAASKGGNGSSYTGSFGQQDPARSTSIVVVPETAKTADRQGRRYDRRRVLLEAESVQL